MGVSVGHWMALVAGWRCSLDGDGHLDDVGHWMAIVFGWRWSLNGDCHLNGVNRLDGVRVGHW
jgi:hypothetical protein